MVVPDPSPPNEPRDSNAAAICINSPFRLRQFLLLVPLLTPFLMCQFCGVDPEFASFFDKQSTETTTTTRPSKGDAPNYFRMKPDHPRYSKLTTPQLTTFASKLSPSAKVLLASHHGDAFEKASQRWSNQAVKTALAIVQVATPEDVSKTVS